MSDDTYTFDSARVRLEQIAAEVRKKDTSLEKSLDLLEEGVRLANQCTELIDATQWRTTLEEAAAEGAESMEADGPEDLELGDVVIVEEIVVEELEDGAVIEDVVVTEFEVAGDEAEADDTDEVDAADDAAEGDDAADDAEEDAADSAWAADPGHDDDERS
jgi:exodeoxyribonuclease VII small subunit